MRQLGLILVLALVVAVPARAQGTDQEISRQLFDELFAPVERVAAGVESGGIAVRGAPATAGPERQFFEEVGRLFLDRGFDVWILAADEVVPEDVLALDVALQVSEIDYPRQTRSLLGAGRARVQRRVSLGAQMRLTLPRDGRVLYDATPVRVTEQWMSFSDAHRNAEERPDWMGAAPVTEIEPRHPWWHRALVAGVIGGVAVIYFSGAS